MFFNTGLFPTENLAFERYNRPQEGQHILTRFARGCTETFPLLTSVGAHLLGFNDIHPLKEV